MKKGRCLILYAFLIAGYAFCYGTSDDWMNEFGDFDSNFESDFSNNPKKDTDSGSEKNIPSVTSEEDWIKEDFDLETDFDGDFPTDIDNHKEDSDSSFGKDTDNHKKDSDSSVGKDIDKKKSDEFFGKDIDNHENNSDRDFEKDDFGVDSEKDLNTDFSEGNGKNSKKDCEDWFGSDFGDGFGDIDNNVENCVENWFPDDSTTNTEDPKQNIKACNLELIGEIEKMITKKIKDVRKYEPMDFDSELKVALFMKIHDGKMTGLSTLTNVTKIQSACMDNNTKILMNTTLKMTNPKITYNWTRKGPFGFTQKGTFWIRAEVINFYIEIVLDTTEERKVTYNVTPTLLAKAEDFTMKFEGLWVFDYVVNFWIETIFSLFKLKIKTVIEGLVKYVIEQKVDIIVRLHNNPIFK